MDSTSEKLSGFDPESLKVKKRKGEKPLKEVSPLLESQNSALKKIIEKFTTEKGA